MKKLYYLIVLALILGLVLTGCTLLSNISQVPATGQSGISYLTKGVPSGLVGLWHFDEGSGTTAIDSSWSGNTGTLVNDPQRVLGRFGDALRFDGDDYVEVLYPIEATTAITMEAWVWVSTSPSGDAEVISKWEGAGNGVIHFEIAPDLKVRMCLRNDLDTYIVNFYSTEALPTDEWVHVAEVWNGTTATIYFDGIAKGSQSGSGTIRHNINMEYWVGSAYGTMRYFDGLIDEVRIWDIALLPEDILRPAISVEKSGPEVAHVDDDITYGYTVTNTGYVPLSDVTVSDDLAENETYVSGDDNANGLLDLEEDWIFTANYTVPDPCAGPVINTATTTGEYGEQLVDDTESWSITILHPAIEVEKSANPAMTHSGEEVTYTIVVTNTGDCALSVDVVDDVLGDIALGVSLAAGDSVTYNPTDSPNADVTNTVTATGTDAIDGVVSDEGSASVDVLIPAILVDKSADTDAADPGETVTYTIWLENTGDCELSVHVVDELLGIDRTITLAAGVDVSADFEYIIPDDAPEYVRNTVTATGTDAIGGVVEDQDDWTVHTMGARTIGYWKTHSDAWCNFPSGSMFAEKEYADLAKYFPGLGAEVDGVNPLEMLRAQLIASELNYACFNSRFDYSRYDGGAIFGTMRDSEAFLSGIGTDDLNTFWSDLGKTGQREFRNDNADSLALKDILEAFNAMGDEIFE